METETTSLLSPESSSIAPLHTLMVAGNVFKTTLPDFVRHGVSEVVYLGTHGTRTGNFYLIESIAPSKITGEKKAFNITRRKIHSGRVDHHFKHAGFANLVPAKTVTEPNPAENPELPPTETPVTIEKNPLDIPQVIEANGEESRTEVSSSL